MVRNRDSHEGLHAVQPGGASMIKIGCIAAVVGALTQGVFAGDTLTTWQYSTAIMLNTSATGANVTTSQKDFPVLIRLTSLNAATVFATARSDGGDLRFSHAGDTGQLPYELNKYDPVRQKAFIWVKADSVQGNNASQSIRMWWGKSSVTTTSDSAAVFAPANGFSLVLHLNKSSGSGTAASPYTFGDATGQGNNGLGYGVVDSPAVIDSGRSFNREVTIAQDSIVVNSLFGKPQIISLSIWIKADSIDQGDATATRSDICSVGNFIDFRVAGTPAGDSIRTSYHYGDSAATNYHSDDNLLSSASGPQFWYQGWRHVAYVFNYGAEMVYVNGVLWNTLNYTDSITWASENFVDSYTKLGSKNGPNQADTSKFFGTMSELRIEKVARPADWIKLCFKNQQASDSLTSLSATGPAIPTLSLPVTNTVIPSLTLTLSWNTAALATMYGVQVSTDVNFGSEVFQENLTITSVVPIGLANSTTYYWRVNATGTTTSAWSSVWSFTTAGLGSAAGRRSDFAEYGFCCNGRHNFLFVGRAGPRGNCVQRSARKVGAGVESNTIRRSLCDRT